MSLEQAAENIRKGLREKYKYDPRGPNVFTQAMQSVVVNPSMPIQVKVSANAFAGIINAAISTALSRGWSLNAFDDNYIYWAWVYQANLLIQAAKGGVPYTGNVPRWINLLVQAVIKTSVKYRGGSVSYAMVIQDALNDSFEQLMGPPAYKHIYSLGVKTPILVNGLFPIVGPPVAYTTTNGEAATQNLWLFLEEAMGTAMHRMEPFNTENCMTKDVSAFAWFSNAPGGGLANTGAWFKQLYHEVAIRKPMFSVFSPADPDLFVNRSSVKLRIGSGDSNTLGGLLIDGLAEKQLGYKTAAVPKFIDFLEYADVFCKTIQQALQLRCETAAFVENVKNDSDYFVTDLQCPLTLQEFLILFRATCLLVYTDTIKYQSLYPRSASGPTDNEFVVYNCGVTTCPIPFGDQMLLPMMLKENILANKSRIVEAGKNGDKNPVQLYGVLGQYNNDRLACTDYLVEYTVDDIKTTYCPFVTKEGETEINLIDGYFSQTPDGHCAINDPAALMKLARDFNEWIQGQGDHFRTLDSITADSGIDACATIGMTLHWKSSDQKLSWKRNNDELKETGKVKSKKKKPVSKYGSRVHKLNLGTTVYSSRDCIAVSAGYEVFQSVWTQFQQYWVQPINNIDSPNTVGDNTGYLRMSGFMREPRQISLGTGSYVFSTIDERHASYAALMVKTKFALKTAAEKAILDLAEKSEAGILGAITGSLVGAVGHAAVDVGASMLDKLPY
jgi:hypothetical protein